jgi:hypothetical protein
MHASGCQQAPVTVPVRSLERSGRASFVCLDQPGSAQVALPLDRCNGAQVEAISQYCYEDDAGDVDAGVRLPHLYALVTQTTRGEVAVIDTTSVNAAVLDENPREPGANFLPIGANPAGIVSTPGSLATFVGVGEIGRAGLFALPSSRIRPATANPDTTCLVGVGVGVGGTGGTGPAAGTGGTGGAADLPVPQLTSWPACSLPSAPGDVILIDDPALPNGQERPSCDDGYATPDRFGHDLLSGEGHGRQKLVVALPDLGGVAIIDAQELFNRPAGSFDACKVERWLPLEVDLSGLGQQQPPTPSAACTNPKPTTPALASSYRPRPAALTYADRVLYVADHAAPVIHVIDMPTPCEPVERAPLLPTSWERPDRVVTTNRIAVAPVPTPDLKRYLYAADVDDASVMVFDVSPDATVRRPLVRAHPEWNPLQPRDRVRFIAPPADVIVVQRDFPQTNPGTGIAKTGVRCNPDPDALICVPNGVINNAACDPGTLYLTSANYDTGAGPLKLRGEFAYVALTNGKLAVIDIDDFDAPCRQPAQPTAAAGCALPPVGNTASGTNEVSCNIVMPNAPRSAQYEAGNDVAGNHVPGIGSPPVLYKFDSSTVEFRDGPQMKATVHPCAADNDCPDDNTECLPAVGVCGPKLPKATTCDHKKQPDPNVPNVDCATHPFGPVCSTKDLCVCREETTDCLGSPTGLVCQKNGSCGCGSDADCPASAPVCYTNLGVPRCGAAVSLFQGSLVEELNPKTGFVKDELDPDTGKPKPVTHTLLMNLEDPRAHVADQNWAVTFEGSVPGFDQKVADLRVATPTSGSVRDGNSRFCDAGVFSKQAISGLLDTFPPGQVQLGPDDLADYVQILNDVPEQEDSYWMKASCTYAACLADFGPTDVLPLLSTRDLRIVEAYQDHVDVEIRNQGSRPSDGAPLDLDHVKCCFPTVLGFTVRVGHQWIVAGDQTGFIHHVVPDATSGQCRDTCDPVAARRNGRVLEAPPDAVVADGARPFAFINPMFRFAISSGALPSERDMQFRFTSSGAFVPLLVPLNADATSLVEPQAITFVPSSNELAITDGSINGLIMVSVSTATLSRSFF